MYIRNTYHLKIKKYSSLHKILKSIETAFHFAEDEHRGNIG